MVTLAAIQVYEMPGMKQVAEWQHNKTTIQRQIGIIKQICDFMVTEGVNMKIVSTIVLRIITHWERRL